MNVALLGPGSIAEDHARALRELRAHGPELTLRAVMGPQREAVEAFARRHRAAYATTDLDRLLDDSRVNAVIVCFPASAMPSRPGAVCGRANTSCARFPSRSPSPRPTG